VEINYIKPSQKWLILESTHCFRYVKSGRISFRWLMP